MRVWQQNTDGTWGPSIPEPFWVRRFLRWKPACYGCRKTFKTREDYAAHWRTMHEWQACGDRSGGYFCAKPRAHRDEHESCGGTRWGGAA